MTGSGDALIPIAIIIALGGVAIVARQAWEITHHVSEPPKPARKARKK